MAKKTTINVDDFMSTVAAVNNGPKSKSKIVTHDVPELKYLADIVNEDGKVVKTERDYISDWVEADDAIATAESLKAVAEQHIIPLGDRLRIADSRNTHEFKNSVKLRVIRELSQAVVTFTQKCQFSDIDQDVKPLLEKVCADEGVEYKDYFSSVPVISLKKDLDEKTIKDAITTLVNAFGSKFTDIFDCKYPVRVNPSFMKDAAFKENVARILNKLGPGSTEAVIRPYKASLKKD